MLCKFWIHLRALRYTNFTQINAKLKFRFKHAVGRSEKTKISIDFHHTAMFQQSKKWTLFVNNNRYKI